MHGVSRRSCCGEMISTSMAGITRRIKTNAICVNAAISSHYDINNSRTRIRGKENALVFRRAFQRGVGIIGYYVLTL